MGVLHVDPHPNSNNMVPLSLPTHSWSVTQLVLRTVTPSGVVLKLANRGRGRLRKHDRDDVIHRPLYQNASPPRELLDSIPIFVAARPCEQLASLVSRKGMNTLRGS